MAVVTCIMGSSKPQSCRAISYSSSVSFRLTITLSRVGSFSSKNLQRRKRVTIQAFDKDLVQVQELKQKLEVESDFKRLTHRVETARRRRTRESIRHAPVQRVSFRLSKLTTPVGTPVSASSSPSGAVTSLEISASVSSASAKMLPSPSALPSSRSSSSSSISVCSAHCWPTSARRLQPWPRRAPRSPSSLRSCRFSHSHTSPVPT